MYRKTKSAKTHPRVDLDVVATFMLMIEFGNLKLEQIDLGFLTKGDEELGLSNIFFKNESMVFIDRGRRDLDHHGERNEETSTSKVAEKLGLSENKAVQVLVRLVCRADLQGETQPFDVNDFIKSLQRRDDLTDKDRLRIGIRAVKAGLRFRQEEIERDNPWAKKVVAEFLSKKERLPKFEQYLERLENLRFERPFDLVEIIAGEKLLKDKETAETFGKELLEIIYQDSLQYFEALKEVRAATQISVKDMTVIAAVSENKKFNVAARTEGGTVIVQRSSFGTQILFDTQKVDDKMTDSIISMLRLEECLFQKRQIPETDLRRTGKVEDIPEWHYEKFPQIGKKPGGRLILNGSLTAPDVPRTKIPWETILYITISAARYYPRFNWERWRQERLHYHQGLSK